MAPHGSITTYSGIRFWPLLPNPADIRIEDIAHALSNQCRFAGHSREFYSVAEHSVRVSQHCRPEDALWGLLHDASETFLTDVPAPLKELPQFEAYRAAERRLQRAISTRFGLAPEQPESVGDADRSILGVEIRDLLTSINASQSKRAPQKDKLAITAPWPPRVAEARFLSRFRELCRKV
jgi:5'-deoxynucleotidase YfbR-like HD superfamily hydrolase